MFEFAKCEITMSIHCVVDLQKTPTPAAIAMTTPQEANPQKSREALLAAFEALVVSKPYQQISVGNIVSKADVGRSTFYDHFKNKDELLRNSLVGIVELLAETTSASCDPERVAHLLDHFRDVGDVARSFFAGPSLELLVAAIQEAILERPLEEPPDRNTSPSMPREFSARLAAETMVAMIRAWLNEEDACDARDFANMLHRAMLAIWCGA